jgi:TolB protein
VTRGQTELIRADGLARRQLMFDVPNQATWQPSAFFPDGRRLLLLSMEPRRDGPGRPFEEYYTQTPTHLWTFDLESGHLVEIAHQDRLAVFYTPQLLLREGRLLVQVVRGKVGQVFNMSLDGSDARPFTQEGEGLPYGFSESPDGTRIAFHLASPRGYEIWTSDPWGRNRIRVAGDPGHLYFGPQWSPDGDWLAYSDCLPADDPGHDWCDVRVGRPDGREARALTSGQAMWFAATYGNAHHHGGGSNVVAWTRKGRLLIPRRLPGSRVPWPFQPNRPDTDHFNRDFRPDAAQGGTWIDRIDPQTGSSEPVTEPREGIWDFRCSESVDGRWITFCRASTGGLPSLWVQPTERGTALEIVTDPEGTGIDHPRWLPDPETTPG